MNLRQWIAAFFGGLAIAFWLWTGIDVFVAWVQARPPSMVAAVAALYPIVGFAGLFLNHTVALLVVLGRDER